ncbi:3,4-dihydroxy-2-butanone-4-phosphate synthase [Dichotomicrobium thermohalophilum]|uniref:3,4-dihydroxy-2-butanone 4-phosphate synthase n=1 Tax=Dichotomicrobium thermohalophilum TaxID=933063 RepID=A0A397Q1C5_9HYPH|nr:3,4-dihydroxy-2-butanone-4-phosphate synthase [Dichotomicrobium thermohalophilum]RIA55196.1 GTP cyclohydrolase II /3,4-dihydroxy-2-butanone 4-phosphate synthase [Dichotomicrobium thermohalophilum]
MQFSSIETAIETIRQGGIIIVVDDEDRENEGDFICAAETITPEKVNFMLNGRGLLCVTLTEEAARRLDLAPAAKSNTALQNTAFTVSVDHVTTSTGISAAERATTITALADPGARPEDFARPGHIFPIVGREGGVLMRAGHTEASIDLAALAGLSPAGVLIEILNEDGTMARRDDLAKLAAQHNMPMITIADLIRYRYRHEQIVKRVAEATLPTRFGDFRLIAYDVAYSDEQPVALVKGHLTEAEAPLVRVHAASLTGDVLENLRQDGGTTLHQSLARIGAEGAGAIVYLPQDARGIGLLEQIRQYQDREQAAERSTSRESDARDYGLGIQILKDLGLSKIRVLTNTPKPTDTFVFDGFELQVVEQVPISEVEQEQDGEPKDAPRLVFSHKS